MYSRISCFHQSDDLSGLILDTKTSQNADQSTFYFICEEIYYLCFKIFSYILITIKSSVINNCSKEYEKRMKINFRVSKSHC